MDTNEIVAILEPMNEISQVCNANGNYQAMVADAIKMYGKDWSVLTVGELLTIINGCTAIFNQAPTEPIQTPPGFLNS